jgi:hypothetical protein
MQFVPSARADIQKYYLNTFLKFKETGDLLLYLTGVDNHAITGQVEDGREFKLYLSETDPYEVDYILPHKSFFQYEGNAVMLQRIPARQYFRGISPENTAVVFKVPGQTELNKIPLKFEVLKAFVKKQKFMSLSEAIAVKGAAIESVALGPRMMYMRRNKTIFVDFTPIAKVATDNKHLVIIAPIFKEDLQEFLASTLETDRFILTEKAFKND